MADSKSAANITVNETENRYVILIQRASTSKLNKLPRQETIKNDI